MSEVHTVTDERLRAAYDALGLDPELYNDTAEIVITPHKVEVTRYYRDFAGMVFDPATDGPLMVVTELRLRSAPSLTLGATSPGAEPAAEPPASG